MPIPQFKRDYKCVVSMADIVQPLLLAVATYIVASIGLEAAGLLKVVALLGTSVFLSIFVVSFIVLVPLQRKIITTSQDQSEAMVTMRTIWIKGHDGRALLGVIGLGLAIVTIAV